MTSLERTRRYAGIGSRQTPRDIKILMFRFAYLYAKRGWLLRSGGALGADKSFESGCKVGKGLLEVFLDKDATEAATALTAKYHPAWDRCGLFARNLHARNAMIILGRELNDPVEFVLCWTRDGGATGGTGQGIRIANSYKIPVFNLYHMSVLEKVKKLLGKD